ncbi:MAG: thiamine pyrophosphate-dependent enzyme, partial [Alphaproteobacteria bacterium]
VDGNDVAAVDETAAALLARVRAGAGPHFLLARTYRLKGHTASDPAAYRPAAELEARQADDPLKRCAELLGLRGIGEGQLDAVVAEARSEIAAATAAALASPPPAAALAWTDVQDVGADAWR